MLCDLGRCSCKIFEGVGYKIRQRRNIQPDFKLKNVFCKDTGVRYRVVLLFFFKKEKHSSQKNKLGRPRPLGQVIRSSKHRFLICNLGAVSCLWVVGGIQ